MPDEIANLHMEIDIADRQQTLEEILDVAEMALTEMELSDDAIQALETIAELASEFCASMYETEEDE